MSENKIPVDEVEPRAYTLYHDLGAFQWVARAIQHQERKYLPFWWEYYWGWWNEPGQGSSFIKGVRSSNAPSDLEA